MLYVYDACPLPSECVAGTRLNGAAEPEILEFPALGGHAYWLVVDGDYLAGDEKGVFLLTVETVPCPRLSPGGHP